MNSKATFEEVSPAFFGYIHSTIDGLQIIEACLRGALPLVRRRPGEREKESLASSGSVYVFIENQSGIKRWTDNIAWSASRTRGDFLYYRELEEDNALVWDHHSPYPVSSFSFSSNLTTTPPPPPSRHRSSPGYPSYVPSIPQEYQKHDIVSTEWYSDDREYVGFWTDARELKLDGMVKKALTVRAEGSVIHLISYYTVTDAKCGRLQRPFQCLRGVGELHIRDSLMYSREWKADVHYQQHIIRTKLATAEAIERGFQQAQQQAQPQQQPQHQHQDQHQQQACQHQQQAFQQPAVPAYYPHSNEWDLGSHPTTISPDLFSTPPPELSIPGSDAAVYHAHPPSYPFGAVSPASSSAATAMTPTEAVPVELFNFYSQEHPYRRDSMFSAQVSASSSALYLPPTSSPAPWDHPGILTPVTTTPTTSLQQQQHSEHVHGMDVSTNANMDTATGTCVGMGTDLPVMGCCPRGERMAQQQQGHQSHQQPCPRAVYAAAPDSFTWFHGYA